MKVNLMQGDCLERMKEIEDGSVDMVLTDPPYGTTACKWDSIIPLEPMWEQLKRIIKPNGAIVMTASQPFTTTLIASNMKMFKYCWHWHKGYSTGFANCNKMPMKAFEDVVVFYSKLPAYNPQGLVESGKVNKRGSSSESMGRTRCTGGIHIQKFTNYPTDEIRTKKERTYHPTGKPVALMEYLIKTYTNEGNAVLDFTMGSGTTGVACVNLNRNFIGIEKDEGYFNIAKERIEGVTKQQELF
jgi:site-specific DNA-methyltransferase (adenine-specific)